MESIQKEKIVPYDNFNVPRKPLKGFSWHIFLIIVKKTTKVDFSGRNFVFEPCLSLRSLLFIFALAPLNSLYYLGLLKKRRNQRKKFKGMLFLLNRLCYDFKKQKEEVDMEKKRSRKNINFKYKNIFIKKGVLTMGKNYVVSNEKTIERVKLGERYYNLEKIFNIKSLIGKIRGMDIEKLSCPSTVEKSIDQRTYKKCYGFFKEILLSGSPPFENQDSKLNKYVCRNDIIMEVIING